MPSTLEEERRLYGAVYTRSGRKIRLREIDAVVIERLHAGRRLPSDSAATIVSDLEARSFGGRVEEFSLVPLGAARLGRIGLDEWVRRSVVRT